MRYNLVFLNPVSNQSFTITESSGHVINAKNDENDYHSLTKMKKWNIYIFQSISYIKK